MVEWLDRTLVLSPYYCLCLNEKDFHKALKHFEIPKSEYPPFLSSWDSNATCHFLQNKSKKAKAAVVCLGSAEGRTPIQVAALLVHEAVHIWQEFLLDIGENNPSQEFEAYSIQNISQSLMESYHKQIIKTMPLQSPPLTTKGRK